MKIQKSNYGTLKDGRGVELFTLSNSNGLSAKITNLGGIIVSLETPDKNGILGDIALGKASLEGYLQGHPFFGALTGRVAGRIGGAQFEIDGQTYKLEKTDPPNCLHGGLDGWDKQIWEASIIEEEGIEKLQLKYQDAAGHNNFPGTVQATVCYGLLEDNSFEITYRAESDHKTPFNPTNHCYFNLNGEASGSIQTHCVQISASKVALTHDDMTLNGQKAEVSSGLNDFRDPIKLGNLNELTHRNADTHYFLDGGRTEQPRQVASVYDPTSGRELKLLTTEPGVQFYGAINLSKDTPDLGKDNQPYKTYGAFCLETQDYPDSIHFPELGSAILSPGEDYYSRTLFNLSVRS